MKIQKEIKIFFVHYDEPRPDSQDAWIFKSPLNIDLNMINFSGIWYIRL